MNAWKRWLASALSAVMLFSLIPAPAFAGMLETNEETASVAESVTEAESENGKASVTEIERDEAELNSAADDIYEVGYRFSEETPWTIVGADKDKSRRDANYRLFAQDGENFNYAIDLAEAFPTREDVKFPLEVYLIVWDAAGKSEELKNGDELYKFDDETDKISILNTNYSLSVYADWLEEFYYQAGDREESKVTADQDWRNAHSKEYEDSADGIAVNLTRMETLPFALKFRVPDGASPLTFSNPSPDGAVETEGQTVTFLTQDASVTVSYKHETNGKEIVSESVFSVHDPYYGEVAYTLNENEENYELDEEPDKNWITFGSDADWAKEYPDNYKTATEETLSLGDDDSFPFRVRFYMRGVSDPAKAFSDETGVQRDENSFVAFFQKKGASLKVGDYAFTTEDLRAGEVRYSAAHIGAKILTRDKNWAESHQRSYIYKEPSDNAHIIRLTEYNTFPVEVTFSLPRDKVSELEFSGTDVTVGKVEAQERNADGSYTLSFKENDASVTFAGYTFTVHSPFEGAVRCEIVGSGRKLIVGANNEANAVYAKELQDAADKGTKERWKSEPDGYVERTRPNYILFGSEQTVIELKEGEYFPCTVKFTRWEPDKGWDEDNADTQVFNSVKEASGADTIITAFKDTNFARQFAIHADWLDEVKYQLPGQSAVIVCNDAEKAAALSHYELFGGKDFAINPNNSIVFPCVVTFTVRNASGSETVAEENFENSDAEAEIRGHTFKIRLAWKGEVVYTLDPNGPFETVKTVGKSDAVGDEAWTWAQTHSDYDIATKSEDGRFFYTIKQEGRLAFPLKVAFQMRDSSNKAEVEFKNLEDTHKYNGITFSIHPEWLDTVEYTLVREVKQDNGDVQTKTLTVEVGTDEEEAKAAKEAAEAAFENATEEQRKNNPFLGLPSYRLSDDDAGNVKIELEDDAFFPYGIQFSYTRLEKSGDNLTPKAVPNEKSSGVVWFEGPGKDYARSVGGYTFYVVSKRTDPAKLVSAGLRINAVKDDEGKTVGGQYIPFVKDVDNPETYVNEADTYWNDKTDEEEYQASLQSLLPLRERGLYINLRGFFDWELENATLEFVRADIPGKTAAKDSIAWSEPIEYTVTKRIEGVDQDVTVIENLSGTYEIIDNGGAVDVSEQMPNGQTYYEMIAGQLDQLDMSDIRYIVRTSTDIPVFNNLLNMKAAYANAERGGIRIKGSGYNSRTKAYTFNVNEQWQDGPVNLTMWLNEDAVDYAHFKKLTARIYEGEYETVEAFKAAEKSAKEITDKVWNQELDMQPESQRYVTNLVAGKKDGAPKFTIIWYRDGVPVAAMPFQVLVSVVPDEQWVDDTDDDTPTDRIWYDGNDENYEILIPHTNNVTIRNKDGEYDQWAFSRGGYDEYGRRLRDDTFTPDESEPYDVEVYHYKVPENEDFGGIAVDRFYVSAKYWRHTRKGSLDSDGKKVEAAFDEPNSPSYYYATAETQAERGKAIWQKYGVKVYAGSKPYATIAEAQADANAVDVTAQIFTAVGYGAEYSNTIYFSFFNSQGRQFDCRGVQIQSESEIRYGDMTLQGDKSFHPDRIEGDKEEEKDVIIWRMPDESYPVSGMYSVRIRNLRDFKEIDWKTEGITVWVSDADCSAKSFDEIEDFAENVTEKAFTDPGYTANYSFGVHFHIYDKSGKLLSHKKIITEAAKPGVKSADTWFQIQGALKKANSWSDKYRYVGFPMPYTADAYYYNGYQTIFLMDRETDESENYKRDEKTGEYIYIPVKDGSEFYPVFWNDEGKNTIYGMHDEGGEIQKSGENKQIFPDYHPGDYPLILEYSAAAENGRHLRNYWVTFLTQRTGRAEIFVNTANDESHWLDRMDENGHHIINREVFITAADEGHDIFFANIGDKMLENLQVRLGNEDVIRLDDYWHLDETRSLAPYSTIQGKDQAEDAVSYGGLRNIAKIRVFATVPGEAKAIDTDLIISGSYYQDEARTIKVDVAQTVHLSGTVGAVRIDKPASGKLRPAVKYVPYANLIRTNNIYGGETVTFQLSGNAPQGVTNGAVDSASPEQYRHYYGRLPNGMEIRSNGEIYGTPTETGLFTFTVTANFSYGGTNSSDSREYTLEVKSNTDENVWMENDWQRDGFAEEVADWSEADKDKEKFGVEYWIPNMVIESTAEAYDHTSPYQAVASADGDEQLLTDERRHRTDEKATPPTNADGTAWTAYHDVVFGIKNYNVAYEEGEADYEWFMDLWINGKKLNGYRVPESEVSRKDKTDEEYRAALLEWVAKQTTLRSVYDYFYGNGCFYGVGTGESVAANSNTDGSANTASGEFRVSGDSNNVQKTAAGNYTVQGPKGTKTPKKEEKPKKDDPKKEDPKPVYNGGGGGGGGGGSTPTYSISTKFDGAQGKSVKLSATSSKSGKTITVTVTPWDGYETESVSVSYGKSKSVSVKRNGNKYTFTMPGADVTVNVTFKLAGPSVFTARVTEVTGGKVSLNISSGTQGTEIYATVTPDPGRVVKALLVNGGAVDAFLLETINATNEAIYRFYLPAANVTVVPEYAWETLAEFSDIDGSMWFFQNAKWAYQEGIFLGVTEYDWMPEDFISSFTAVVTLGRLAKLDEDTLARYAAANPEDYPGIPDGQYAPYARWAMDCGILRWGVYGNKDTLTRGELALMLKRFIELQGIELEVPTGEARMVFADQDAIDALGADADVAFQALNKIGVFQGRSDGTMNPSGNTKRSHLAALLNRISDFIRKYWTDKSAEQESQEPMT